MATRTQRLDRARLYLICDQLSEATLASALAGGVEVVQLRMKGAGDDQILVVAERVRRVSAAHGALFILNDRPDLAAQLDADGVHVGQDDLPVAQARELVGSDRIVGLSTHTPAQIHAAAAAGVDYIGVGPVHATPTKPGRPAVGLGLVRHAVATARLPFFAIGGITVDNVAAVVATGAQRVAVVRAVTEAADPGAAARGLRQALDTAAADGAARGLRQALDAADVDHGAAPATEEAQIGAAQS
jgi:thiamine-phosphate pyrophosphorylase